MKIQEFFESGDLAERVTNFIQLAINIADDYGYEHSPLSGHLSHGVQKDAIQNGWDAKQRETYSFIHDHWRFEFELTILANGAMVLMMTDYGTCGLTGKLTSKDIKQASISAEELPKYERWAKWESHGFTKGEGLGARGQGKMIFMLASKDHTIYYDSLRSDGSYRFGGSTATETGCPTFCLDEDEARHRIKSILGLQPLSHEGTRVIIANPAEEVVQDIYEGNFLRFIEETWWPIIHKYGTSITVKYDGKVDKAGVPDLFPITKETYEDDNFKTWVKDENDFKKMRVPFKIKRLCVGCHKGKDVDELYQGIACFRDGMKVDVVRIPEKAFRNKVYGYIEFDHELEDELREIEKPTHYAFKSRSPWRPLKSVIEQQLEAFGNKKLELAIDRQALANIRRNAAESKALSILKAVTKDWPISKWSKGVGGGGGGGNGTDKRVGIRLSNLQFPNPGNVPRLDYGQTLEGFDIVVFNKEDMTWDVTLDAFVISGDRPVFDVRKESLKLQPKSSQVLSTNRVAVTKKDFQTPGEYKLRFNLKDGNGNRIDQITRRIWIETDPKLAGPFDVRGVNFSELPKTLNIDKNREWVLEPEGDGKYTFFYNWGHEAYTHNDESDVQLITYLSELFLMGALELLIREGIMENRELTEAKEMPLNLETVKSSNPLGVYREFTLALSKVRQSMYGMV